MKIRLATENDIQAITDIYNEAVLRTVATFDTVPRSIDEQLIWLQKHDQNHPVIVILDKESIVGWASLSEYSNRKAYDKTVEISLYVKEAERGKGIGKELINSIVKLGEELGHRTILARITSGNDNSVHLHRKVGFEHVGTMKQVGEKFGEILDVHIMQKIY